MHEMGIAMEVIKIAKASIPSEAKGVRVLRVNLMVGKLAAVVPDSLRFCFDIAGKATPLSGSELVIEEIPVQIRCLKCRNEWSVEAPVFRCPTCDSGSVKIVSGRELDIRSIEIEEEGAHDFSTWI